MFTMYGEIVALVQSEDKIVERMNRTIKERQVRIQARHLMGITAADPP
jgi:hypothetical protein